MKKLSTSNNVRIRVLALLTGLLLSGFLPGFAATKHVVQVTDFSFSPSNVTIKAGDTVEWRNVQGFHNVNGSKGIFPNNPVSFGNNVAAGWTYQFVFLNTGIYNYQCDPHAAMGMTGIVTVTVSTSVQSLFNGDQDLASIQLYPNPSAGKVTLQIPSAFAGNLDMSVFDVTGRLRFTANSAVQEMKEIDLENLDKGMYLVEFRGESWRKTMKLLLE